MRLFSVLLLTLPLLSHSYPTTSGKEEKSISLEDVDNDHAESGTDVQLEKRSGSFDYVTQLKSGLLSSIGHASASIASGSSGGSSGGGTYKSHGEAHHGNSVDYDPWSFKKSVLNTIFQAVKAITGGVTALKGQLIKGSGYVLSASGKLVAASGDKVTDVGKNIINSAQIHTPSYGHSGGGVVVHPFAKFSSLSGASSGGSSGHSKPGPVVHTETITTYEIPHGHASYGPPSKPPTYSSATHQYLPPSGGSYSGGGAPFTGGHAAFEAPSSNYVPSSYGHEDKYSSNDDEFNIYPRHKKLTDQEARKAAAQLQEILSLLPNGGTEYTASKTVTLDQSGYANGHSDVHPEHVEITNYGLPNDLGPLETLSHTESITAAYGPPAHSNYNESPSDIYHQMAKKQSPEEVYLQKHPNEGYDYQKHKQPNENEYKYKNYHAGGTSSSPLKDLTPIIAALEVAKRREPSKPATSTSYAIEKNVYKAPPAYATGSNANSYNNFQYLPSVVQKSKYTYFDSAQNKASASNYRPVYSATYKVRRHVPSTRPPMKGKLALFKPQDYEIQDPLLFNQMLAP